MASRAFTSLALAAVTLLSGCSMFRSYDTELQATNQQLATGNVDGALTLLEKNNTGDDKDLLYYFEKGELLRAKGDLTGSQVAWRSADLQVYKWEESVKFDTDKYLAQFGAFLVNDKVRRYEGYDYEKVMLTTQMALNLLALNDFDGARTELTDHLDAVLVGPRVEPTHRGYRFEHAILTRQRQLPRPRHTAHEGHGMTIALCHDHSHVGRGHKLRERGREYLFQLLRCQTFGLYIVDERHGDLAVPPNRDIDGEIRVLPDNHSQHVWNANHVVLTRAGVRLGRERRAGRSACGRDRYQSQKGHQHLRS